jgi:hypothetical protein
MRLMGMDFIPAKSKAERFAAFAFNPSAGDAGMGLRPAVA